MPEFGRSPAGNRSDRDAPWLYAVQPIPGKLIFYRSIGGIIETIIVGAMVGAIYKPASARSSSQ